MLSAKILFYWITTPCSSTWSWRSLALALGLGVSLRTSSLLSLVPSWCDATLRTFLGLPHLLNMQPHQAAEPESSSPSSPTEDQEPNVTPYVRPGDFQPVEFHTGPDNHLLSLIHNESGTAGLMRQVLVQGFITLQETAKTPFNIYHIVNTMLDLENTVVHLKIGVGESFMDIEQLDYSGPFAWWRLTCSPPTSNVIDTIAQLAQGTGTRPPLLRVGADLHGTFLELIEVNWFLRLRGATTGRCIGKTRAEVNNGSSYCMPANGKPGFRVHARHERFTLPGSDIPELLPEELSVGDGTSHILNSDAGPTDISIIPGDRILDLLAESLDTPTLLSHFYFISRIAEARFAFLSLSLSHN